MFGEARLRGSSRVRACGADGSANGRTFARLRSSALPPGWFDSGGLGGRDASLRAAAGANQHSAMIRGITCCCPVTEFALEIVDRWYTVQIPSYRVAMYGRNPGVCF